MGEQRNLMIAIALAMLVMILYQTFVIAPAEERRRAVMEAAQEAAAVQSEDGVPVVAVEDGVPVAALVAPKTREEALSETARVAISTPALNGSINLTGARIDDLDLLRYRRTVDQDSPPVTFLNPAGGPYGTYAYHGWLTVAGGPRDLPGPTSEWRLVQGDRLTTQTPVTLRYDSEDGLVFLRTISIDDDYMFTIADEVRNESGADVILQHYGVVRRNELPPDFINFMILHEGMVGVVGGKHVMRKYKRLRRDQEREIARGSQDAAFTGRSTGGWLGVTDKYWLAAIIPPRELSTGDELAAIGMRGAFEAKPTGRRNEAQYLATFLLDPVAIQGSDDPRTSSVADAPGAGSAENVLRVTSHLFAGAKQSHLLEQYGRDLGIDRFEWAIDWGNFWFLTKPFFSVLHYLGQVTGNFGVAILCLTVLVKAVFFPIANSSYKAMAKMKALQPQMQELRERFAADPKRQQQELVGLYQREKVNPLAGCLPLIPQMIVFFALYKTLFVTIEMRHAPFVGWIQDLSAPDPTNMWNIFGLLPYDPSGWLIFGDMLAIGVWPLLMGLTMGAMQTLNPPPPDPMQARIFAFLPVVFTIILAPFAAGLVIYWTWNNVLSFAQQYLIMRRQGVDTPIGAFLAKRWEDARAGRLGDQFRDALRRLTKALARQKR
ncbi:MAG: membrane protein insertase YidC [Caulobacterales bacterium]|nr:membrane protein insertase YidC [Caulobacterales bacterium]